MESQEAFVRLSRKFFVNCLWEEDREYSRAEAWLDLLQGAAFAPYTQMVKGHPIALRRGSLVASVRWLCQRWKWSNTKVCRFLDCLEREGMITREKRHEITLISLCKYEEYNPRKRRENDAETTGKRRGNDKVEEDQEGKEEQEERECSPGPLPEKPARTSDPLLTDEGFLTEIRQLYPHADIDAELRKMRAWLLTPRGRGKRLTRQRVINWLNRCDTPLTVPASPNHPPGEAPAYTWG